jgi:DNA polymerase I-like protein with 3'-5' exonuclease and polymerase domains
MKYAILDVESTTFAKGNPYAQRNKLCLVGLRIKDTESAEPAKNYIFKIEYDEEPYAEQLASIRSLLSTVDVIVGFNLKFDLAWLARYGIFLSDVHRVFDCQLAYFILDFQRTPFPSLDLCLAHYGLGSKLDTVEREYWSVGIDTCNVPLEVLVPYLTTDLEKTDELFNLEPFQSLFRGTSSQSALCKLHMQDLLVLFEMEYNGLRFDWAALGQAAAEAELKLVDLDKTILEFVPSGFRDLFNGGSGVHLSALLYGGTIVTRRGTPYQHTYKSGDKEGRTETRYKWEEVEVHFPTLVEPPEGSELKKKGFYSVDEETLKSCRAKGTSKELITAILQRSETEKLLGTYYKGIPEHLKKYDWIDFIHGTYNQCRVITGRLSSEKPNLQNFPDVMQQYIVTRFP